VGSSRCYISLAEINPFLRSYFGVPFLSSLCLGLLEGGAKLCIVAALEVDTLVDPCGTLAVTEECGRCGPEVGIRCDADEKFGRPLAAELPWFRDDEDWIR
jgi:hypothetical protein